MNASGPERLVYDAGDRNGRHASPQRRGRGPRTAVVHDSCPVGEQPRVRYAPTVRTSVVSPCRPAQPDWMMPRTPAFRSAETISADNRSPCAVAVLPRPANTGAVLRHRRWGLPPWWVSGPPIPGEVQAVTPVGGPRHLMAGEPVEDRTRRGAAALTAAARLWRQSQRRPKIVDQRGMRLLPAVTQPPRESVTDSPKGPCSHWWRCELRCSTECLKRMPSGSECRALRRRGSPVVTPPAPPAAESQRRWPQRRWPRPSPVRSPRIWASTSLDRRIRAPSTTFCP